MELNFRHLHLVHTLSEAGSIRLAAKRMGVPQPALSRQLARLEKSLGATIAIRSTTGVELTPAGEVLARHAIKAADILTDVHSELQELTAGDAPDVPQPLDIPTGWTCLDSTEAEQELNEARAAS